MNGNHSHDELRQEILEYSFGCHPEPDRIELDVEAELPGLLAVSETYHPGWRAYVDSGEVPVWRINVAFRGVEVPAGRHRITFEYESRSYRLGLWMSLLTTFGVGAVMWLSWRRSRAASPESPICPG